MYNSTNRPKLNVWITKYALTLGIFNRDVEHCLDISDNMVSDITNKYNQCWHKPDWHLTKEEAIARAEDMRVQKIKSLNKAIKKLENIKFS
jgi:hypothetical protein